MKPLIYIAGGSKGLGRSLCEKFEAEGWEVIELSRSGQNDDRIQHIDCDFSDTESANHVFTNLFKNHQSEQRPNIQLIINAATLAPFGNIAKAKTEEIQQHLNINIVSTTLLVHQFAKAFQSHPAKKTLTFISSGAARRSIEGMSLYCASKAALEHLILTFNLEQKRQEHPIHSLIINPGVMDTDMQIEIRRQSADDFPMISHWETLHQKGQLADTETIAQTCHNIIKHADNNTFYHQAQTKK